jgi:hypothetical protein
LTDWTESEILLTMISVEWVLELERMQRLVGRQRLSVLSDHFMLFFSETAYKIFLMK